MPFRKWLSHPTGKWVAILCILGGFVLTYLVVEHVRGRVAIAKWRHAALQRGEKLSVTELTPPLLSSDKNCAELINEIARDFPKQRAGIYPMELRGNGLARITWATASWTNSDIDSSAITTNSWQQVASAMAPVEPSLRQLGNALRTQDYRTSVDYEQSMQDLFGKFPVHDFMNLRTVEKHLTTTALLALATTNHGNAKDALTTLVVLVSKLSGERTLMMQLIRQAMAHTAIHTSWELLQADSSDDASLKNWQTLWEEINFLEDYRLSAEMERAMGRGIFRSLRNSSELRIKAFHRFEDLFNQSVAPDFSFPRWARAWLWRIAWCEQDEARVSLRWDAIIHLARQTERTSWPKASWGIPGNEPTDPLLILAIALANDSDFSVFERFRFPVATMPFGIGDLQVRQSARYDTFRGMVILAIALERYKLRHHSYPKAHTELMPEYVKRIPKDYMDGRELKYRLNSDGTFLLYSSGENGVDDGGDPAKGPGVTNYREIWDGKDAVWPKALRE